MLSMAAYALRLAPDDAGVWKAAATGMGSLMPATTTVCLLLGHFSAPLMASQASTMSLQTCGLYEQVVKAPLCSQDCHLLRYRSPAIKERPCTIGGPTNS